jgi:hypothetical protein
MLAFTNSMRRLVVFLILIFSCSTCWAYSREYYDLDSLVYLSEEILVGRIGNTDRAKGFDLTELKVDSVYMGVRKKGDTVKITGLYAFRKPATTLPDLNSIPLEKGTQLIVFLDDVTPKSIRPEPGSRGDTEYQLVGCGVRAVVNGKVLRFYQRGNPGPYVVESDAGNIKRSPSLEDFARQISETVPRMKDFAAKLDKATASGDAQWFVRTLRERAELARSQGTRSHYTDHLSDLAAMGLADLHTPELLEQALKYGTWQTRILAGGFGTPAGRDYLLGVIKDAKQPQERRLRLAGVIGDAYFVYGSRLKNIETNSGQIVGKAGVKNDNYITRIARVVLENITDEKLCLTLMRTIDFFGRTIVQTNDDDTRADFKQALAVLKEAYDKCTSETLRFEIEQATAHFSRELYDRLGSRCGSVISRLYYTDPKRYTVPNEKSLIFQYEYSVVSKGNYETAVVLHSQAQGKEYMLPVKLFRHSWNYSPGSTGGGSNVVVLPKDLPKGKYRVYLQATENGRVVSKGHYYDTDL